MHGAQGNRERPAAEVILLGTGAALPTAERDNTALVVVGPETVLLVDCPGAAYAKLLRAGVDPQRLTHVLLTHVHTDHSAGLPGLLQSLWLGGRTAPLPILGLPDVQALVDGALATFRPFGDRSPFALPRQVLPLVASTAPVLETADFRVWTTPGDHSVPSVAVRVEAKAGGAVVYSSDTRPCATVRELARGATLLVHEATFLGHDAELAARHAHSTGAQAARLAQEAGVRRLALVHFTPRAAGELARLREEAAAEFGGEVIAPSDLARFTV
ncbi:MAG: ribonuclease Z [Chloroflexi bacterium]|nr:ribonuclease Z [Chloroflexota bacterium]